MTYISCLAASCILTAKDMGELVCCLMVYCSSLLECCYHCLMHLEAVHDITNDQKHKTHRQIWHQTHQQNLQKILLPKS